MNNEFKKLSQGDVTRYVLESGSSGGTSSGSVASVSMPMGGMHRRKGDNLIAQEADKNTVPASTPRNLVAKNAKTAGAGAHKDKSKTIPRKEKHKKPFMEDHSTATGGWGQGSYDTYTAGNHGRGVAENERDHPDHEIQMASSELLSIAKNAESLLDMVRRYSEQEGLDAWQQSKITKAADYLNSVLQSINGEQQGVAEGAELKKAKRSMNQAAKDANVDQVGAGKKIDTMKNSLRQKDINKQGVAEGLNEFALDGFNGGDDGEEFNPRMAKMAYDEGVVKGASLADGATTQRAMAINDWDKHDGGIYSQHFAKGFKAGRLDKIRHSNKQYNLNLKLMKDGSIRHGEQGVAEGMRKWLVIHSGSHGEGGKMTIEAPDFDTAWKLANEYDLDIIEIKPVKGVAEGAKVDRQAKHITASMMKKGKSKKDAESIAWAHIKHPKNESVDTYFESLNVMLERQLEPTMDLDAWNNNFQNADPNKYHQFKNKTPEKKK